MSQTVVTDSPRDWCCAPSPASLCPAESLPGWTLALLVLAPALLALQNSLIYHWKETIGWPEQGAAAKLPSHVEGGGGLARGAQCLMRLPEG